MVSRCYLLEGQMVSCFLCFVPFVSIFIIYLLSPLGIYTCEFLAIVACHVLDCLGENCVYLTQIWAFFTCIFGACFNTFWLLFVLYLTIRTARSSLTNVTFYEMLKKPEYIRDKYGECNTVCWDFKGLNPIKAFQ